MPTVRWPDGHNVSAPTWRELERMLPTTSLFDNGLRRRAYRRAMRARARRWSGVRIGIRGSSERFIREMVRARLLEMKGESR